MSTLLFGVLLGCLCMGLLLLLAVSYLQRELRVQTRALRDQIGDERVAAARDQTVMLKVATDAGQHDLAWQMIEACVPGREEYVLARDLLAEPRS